MEVEQVDHALEAANVALSGRRLERAASRFASIQLRGLNDPPRFDRHYHAWECAAIVSVGVAAVLFVVGLWCL